jgi:hypothetical protein
MLLRRLPTTRLSKMPYALRPRACEPSGLPGRQPGGPKRNRSERAVGWQDESRPHYDRDAAVVLAANVVNVCGGPDW